jgi:hypothetical protein
LIASNLLNFQPSAETDALENVPYPGLVFAVGERLETFAMCVDLVTQVYLLGVICSAVRLDAAMAIAVLLVNAHVMITGLATLAALLYVTLHARMGGPVLHFIVTIVTFVFAHRISAVLTAAFRIAVLRARLLVALVL